jgi:hypothetical protein
MEFRKGCARFRELSSKGFAYRCNVTRWAWVREHLKWNPPENPNQRKAAAKVVQTIPDKCEWKAEFLQVCGPALGLPAHTPANPLPTVPQPLLNQEQKQTEQEQKGSSARKRQTSLPDGFAVSDRVRAWGTEKGHSLEDLQNGLNALVSYAKRKGAKYLDWDEALMTAVRDGWARPRNGGDAPTPMGAFI